MTIPCICSYPDMKLVYTQPAHSSNCICIKFDQSGQYFATGSADALMSLWDITDLTCLRTFARYVEKILHSYITNLIKSLSRQIGILFTLKILIFFIVKELITSSIM